MTVYLVGAGPGDPDLMTIKAARLCSLAEVVLHDRLISQEILDMIAPWAEIIDVGKNPSGKKVSQQQIHQLLIDRGLRHEVVVRLKGGDPFVFGRGAEEAAALAAHGIAVEIVPGITSSIAGPAAAGVAVTKRSVSSAFTVVTGHQDPQGEQSLNWAALATLGTTLVILMGAKRAAKIRATLIAAGMSQETPVAIVCSATTSNQTTQRLLLKDLGKEPIANPAIIVVGEVAHEDEGIITAGNVYRTQGVKIWS